MIKYFVLMMACVSVAKGGQAQEFWTPEAGIYDCTRMTAHTMELRTGETMVGEGSLEEPGMRLQIKREESGAVQMNVDPEAPEEWMTGWEKPSSRMVGVDIPKYRFAGPAGMFDLDRDLYLVFVSPTRLADLHLAVSYRARCVKLG